MVGATMLYGSLRVVPEWRNGALASCMAAHPDTSLGTEGALALGTEGARALAPRSLTTDAKSSRSGDDLSPARRRVWICRGGSHGRRATCPACEGCIVTSPASAPARRRREPSGWLRLVLRGGRDVPGMRGMHRDITGQCPGSAQTRAVRMAEAGLAGRAASSRPRRVRGRTPSAKPGHGRCVRSAPRWPDPRRGRGRDP